MNRHQLGGLILLVEQRDLPALRYPQRTGHKQCPQLQITWAVLQRHVQLGCPCLRGGHVFAILAFGQAAVAVCAVVVRHHGIDGADKPLPAWQFGRKPYDNTALLAGAFDGALFLGNLGCRVAVCAAIRITTLIAAKLASAVDGVCAPSAFDQTVPLRVTWNPCAVLNAQSRHETVNRAIHCPCGLTRTVVGVHDGGHTILADGMTQRVTHRKNVFG